MDVEADLMLRRFFTTHADKVESWFNIITPSGRTLKKLQEELRTLNDKQWVKILST